MFLSKSLYIVFDSFNVIIFNFCLSSAAFSFYIHFKKLPLVLICLQQSCCEMCFSTAFLSAFLLFNEINYAKSLRILSICLNCQWDNTLKMKPTNTKLSMTLSKHSFSYLHLLFFHMHFPPRSILDAAKTSINFLSQSIHLYLKQLEVEVSIFHAGSGFCQLLGVESSYYPSSEARQCGG